MSRSLIAALGGFLCGAAAVAVLFSALGKADEAEREPAERWSSALALGPEEAPLTLAPQPAGAAPEPPAAAAPSSAASVRTTEPKTEREAADEAEETPGRLELDLSFGDGLAPSSATVTYSSTDEEGKVIWHPDSRGLELTPGVYEIVIGCADGALGARLEGVQLRAGETQRRAVALEGRGAAIVCGLSGGNKLGSTLVYLKRLNGAAPQGSALVAQADEYRSGEAVFQDLAPGRYLIGVGYDYHCARPVTIVTVNDRPVFVELPSFPKDQIITAELSGASRENSTLAVSARGGDDNAPVSWAEEDGRVLVALQCREKARRAGEMELFVWTKEGLGRARFRPLVDRRVRIPLTPSCELTVQVEGIDQSGHEGRLQVYWSSESGREIVTVDAQGRARLESLFSGRGEASLYAWAGHSGSELARRKLTLGPGSNALSLTLPPLHRLEVQTGLAENDYLSLEAVSGPQAGRDFGAQIQANGRAVFLNLAAGVYKLESRTLSRRVQVPGPPVILGGPNIRSWRVRIDDARGALARLGLRQGDRILAVDGQSPEGKLPPRSRQVTVLRSGGSQRLALDLSKLDDRGFLLGGALEPSGD